MPKVSVIIPVYNTEQYLRECLDSVVNQTLKDIEIICVNDGSTDNSGRILEEYAEKDSRIKVIHKENTGSANSRNVGIEIATGEYLGFIDSDDYISKNYFQELYKSALKNDADIAMTTGLITWKNKKKSKKPCGVNKKQNLITSQKDKSEIIITTGVSCNKIYKKTFLQDNNINYLGIHSAAEDNYFTDIAIIKANKISVIHNAIYNYVLRNQSLSQHLKNEKDFNCIDVYNKIEEYIIKNIASEEDAKIWLETIRKRKQKDYVYHIDTMQPNCVEKFLVLIKKSLEKKLIVSLTSFPARINTVYKTIESLLNQTLKADAVILWLAEEQFPNKEKDLPKYLLELTKKGLTISWCEDIRSYKKLIPTLKQYPNDIIVTVDDDIIYNKDTLKNLYLTYLKNDNCIICHRAHYITFNWGKINSYSKWINCVNNYKKSSYNLFFTGCGAVLYPPNCLHKDIFNKDLFQKLAKDTDDIWFWAMATLNNFKIKIAEKPILDLKYIDGTQEQALYLNNCDGGNNDKNIKLILDYYPQILTKLEKENDIYKNKLEKLFSVRNNIKTCHKVITICGVCFKIKSNQLEYRKKIKNLEKNLESIKENFKSLKENYSVLDSNFNKLKNSVAETYSIKFIAVPTREKSVLLIEPNFGHDEVLPGIAKYFIDLGYNVDILMSFSNIPLQVFTKFQSSKIRIFEITFDALIEILTNKKINNYDFIYFNSDRIYSEKIWNTALIDKMNLPSNKILQMCHHIDEISNFDKFNVTTLKLANLAPKGSEKSLIVNSHYFGEFETNKKNDKINFIIVGNIQDFRKNFNLLIDSVNTIIERGFSNFKITLVSRLGSLEDIPTSIRKYFDLKGFLPFPEMYNEMEKADFFLPLLDPECEAHNRYVTTGTSGSFQLIYGFLKPCIINSKFASIPGFDNQNSIIYDKNEELADKMIEAINMSEENYDKMRSKLKDLADNIYQESLDNLRKILKSAEGKNNE